MDFRGRKLVVESGEMAKQAAGAVLVRYCDTAILSASVMSKNATTGDFFPLTINYQEKLYSVGKIPGGFIKREGRPTEQAILAARLIDRPIRPLFAEGFRNEVQVISTVLSVDQDCSPEMTALFGSSLALMISNIPFEGMSILEEIDGNFESQAREIRYNFFEEILGGINNENYKYKLSIDEVKNILKQIYNKILKL